MLGKLFAVVAAVAATSGVCSASQIVTPFAWGDVPDQASNVHQYEAPNMFNAQPVLVGGVPTGGDATSEYTSAGWDGWDSYAFIDFGENYQNVRIESAWTHYKPGTAGKAYPYQQTFWDSDNNNVKGPNAVQESVASYDWTAKLATITTPGLNFNTIAPTAEGGWVADYQGAVVTPKQRYLMLQFGYGPWMQIDVSRSNEYAFVGTVVPEPASLGLLGATGAALLIRRRRA